MLIFVLFEGLRRSGAARAASRSLWPRKGKKTTFIVRVSWFKSFLDGLPMDEGTIKTQSPKCRREMLAVMLVFSTGSVKYGVIWGEGASIRYSPAAKYLYWLIFKKNRHLGFGVFIDILVHGVSHFLVSKSYSKALFSMLSSYIWGHCRFAYFFFGGGGRGGGM